MLYKPRLSSPRARVTSTNSPGKEKFDILLPAVLSPRLEVTVTTDTGKTFRAVTRFDTDLELTYYAHGGILNYMVRKLAKQTQQ